MKNDFFLLVTQVARKKKFEQPVIVKTAFLKIIILHQKIPVRSDAESDPTRSGIGYDPL